MAGLDVGTVYVTVLPETSQFASALQAQVSTAATAASSTLSKKFTAAGRGLSNFGRSMTRFVSLPIAAAGIASVKLAADFDQSMRNVNSLLGLSEEKFNSMSNAVLRLSTQTPQSADVLAKGLYDIASSGFQGAEALTVLEASATAASAGLSTTDVSARAIVSTLNAYGEGADQAARNSDILFQGVNVGVQTFDELATSIGNYIGAASQLAVPLEDVVGAQAAMTLTGLSASEAAVSLNGIFKTLLKPSEDLADVLKEAGFASGQAALEQEGLQGVMELLSAEVGNNKGRWVELFPEIRAARGAMALASGDGKLLDETMRKMADSVGAAGRAFEEQSKGPAFQFEIAMNKLRKAGIKLGNELIPIITDTIIPAVEDGIRWFRQLSSESKTLALKLAGLALVAGPLLRVAGVILKIAGAASSLVRVAPAAAAAAATIGTATTTPAVPIAGGFGTGAGAGGTGFGAGTIPLVPFNPIIKVEDVQVVDEMMGAYEGLGTAIGVAQRAAASLNSVFEEEGRDLRVNADLLHFAAQEGISYSEAVERVGAAFNITNLAIRENFIPALERGQDITATEQARLVELVNTIDDTGGSLSALTVKQVGNLLAMGDAAAAARVLKGAISQLRNEHGSAGAAADQHAGKVRGLGKNLVAIRGVYEGKIVVDTSQANAAISAFERRMAIIQQTTYTAHLQLIQGGSVNIPGRATGDDRWTGGPVWVGERGPEIVVPPPGSGIVPNNQIKAKDHASRLVMIEGKVDIDTGRIRILAREEIDGERRHRGVLARQHR